MRYVPYGPELEGVPNVIVDGRGNEATILELSHWPRNATPLELKADTSAEIVINYLRSPEHEKLRRGAEAVSNNHYDIDGLISLWAVLNPEAALERAELLVAIGECGDFARWAGERATKVACALHGLHSLPASPLRRGLDEIRGDDERTAFLYRETLPLLSELLEDADRFEQYWRDEYRRVEEGRALFARGEATVQEMPELDLAVIHLTQDIPDMALYEQTERTRIVLIDEDRQRCQARYRYESWVELESRRPLPRIDLRPFADFLQSFEGNPGEWHADDVRSIVPRLGLHGPEGKVSPSSITTGLFLRMFVRFLRENEENAELLWSPYTADAEYISETSDD